MLSKAFHYHRRAFTIFKFGVFLALLFMKHSRFIENLLHALLLVIIFTITSKHTHIQTGICHCSLIYLEEMFKHKNLLDAAVPRRGSSSPKDSFKCS